MAKNTRTLTDAQIQTRFLAERAELMKVALEVIALRDCLLRTGVLKESDLLRMQNEVADQAKVANEKYARLYQQKPSGKIQ
jgi:hypothetical protein